MKTVSKNAVNSNGNSLQTNRRAAAKKKKAIILSIVAAVLVVAVIITLVLVVKKVNEPTPTVSTSYKIDEVTVGNVNTTISGSGSLTPVRSETLTAARMTGEDSVSTFYIKATNENTVNTAMNVTETFLLQQTRDEDAFSVSNESSVLETMDEVDNTMSLLLAGIAAISLVVGGIGIMNIMLVSVTERTKEIGIRKAVGAKRRHIMFQFLCEACVLSVLGGLVGLGLSFAGIQIYNLIAGASSAMNWAVGGAAVAFCAVIGLIFGGYPAAKASRLQPIDALHNS